MKEIIEALNARIKSPVFGYFILFAFFINWKAFFYLIFSGKDVIEKFTYFESNSSINSLFTYPILVAIAYTLIHPWINYLFSFLTSKAVEKKRTLQTIVEHKVLIKKEELEKVRSKLLETQERNLIEQAKREEEIKNIEDDDLRTKLQNEIHELRNKVNSSKIHDSNGTTIEMAKTYKELAKLSEKQGDIENARMYLQEALDIERKYLK